MCADEPAPGDPGVTETFTSSGSVFNTTCYFAVKSADEVPNWSDLSNVASVHTGGVITTWGTSDYGQCAVPEPNADFVAVAAGIVHSLGLKSDGAITAWGNNNDGQCDVPAPNANFTAVAAGATHSLGLK